MGVLIDASVLIDCERRGSDAGELAAGREDEECFISAITASELLHGIHRARDAEVRTRRAAFVEGLLEALPVLPIDLATARTHARLWASLMSAGTIIPAHDLWLAASCITHGLRLMTGNVRHFKRVPGLDVEVWPSA